MLAAICHFEAVCSHVCLPARLSLKIPVDQPETVTKNHSTHCYHAHGGQPWLMETSFFRSLYQRHPEAC